jgi:hypothetical protein
MMNMILTNFNFFCVMLLQRVPPPPNVPGKNSPTPPGLIVPLDTNIWILLIIAIVMIAYVTLPRLKKAA